MPILFSALTLQPADRPLAVFGSGFYRPENDRRAGPFRWMGPKATVRLLVPGDSLNLTIRGRVPAQLQLPVTLELRWNNTAFPPVVIDRDEFVVEQTLPGDPDATWHDLTLSASEYFRPGDVEDSRDTRSLSLRIYNLELRDPDQAETVYTIWRSR
jgi:hypothetical protein